MFKLAHISDIHLAPLPEPTINELFSKRILGYLNWKKNRKHALQGNYLENLIADIPDKKPDHIVVTGDLMNLALPEEFNNALKFLQTLGSPENVSALCGNHDAYVKGALETCIDKWQPNMCGDHTETQSQEDFPYLRIRGEVAIIGCNSAEPTAPFMATGYFTEAQAKRLSKILDQTRDHCRVVCIHHPPHKDATHWHKRLIGDGLFRETIKKHGAELVLHGHTHLATTNWIDGSDGTVPVVCVPAAGNANNGKRPAGRYNLFTIEQTHQAWRITHEAYGYSQSKKETEQLVKTELKTG